MLFVLECVHVEHFLSLDVFLQHKTWKDKDVDGFHSCQFFSPCILELNKNIRQLPARPCVLVIAARGVAKQKSTNRSNWMHLPPSNSHHQDYGHFSWSVWSLLVGNLYIFAIVTGRVNPKHPMLRGWNKKTSPLNPVLCWGFHNPYEPITISKRLRARDCMSQLPLGFRPRSTGEPLEDLR